MPATHILITKSTVPKKKGGGGAGGKISYQKIAGFNNCNKDEITHTHN